MDSIFGERMTNETSRRDFLKVLPTPLLLDSMDDDGDGDILDDLLGFGDEADVTVYAGTEGEKEDISPDEDALYFAYATDDDGRDKWFRYRDGTDSSWVETTSGAGGAFEDTDGDGVAELQDDHADFDGGNAKNVGSLDADEVLSKQTKSTGLRHPTDPRTVQTDPNQERENESLAAGSSVTAHSLNGPAVLQTLHLAISAGDAVGQLNTYLELYVDGESSPSISLDLNTAGMVAGIPDGTDWQWHHDHVRGGIVRNDGTRNQTGFSFGFPVPFESSLDIKLINGSDSNSINYYSTPSIIPVPSADDIPAQRLQSASQVIKRDGIVTLSPSSTHDFLNLSNSSGILAGFYLHEDSAGTRLDIENDIDIYYDGETTPSYRSTGTEDFFQSWWAYMRESTFSNGPTVVGVNPWGSVSSNEKLTQGIDLLELNPAYRWDTGVTVQMDSSEASYDTDLAYTVLYYEDV